MGCFRNFYPRIVLVEIPGFYRFQSYASILHLIFKRKKVAHFWKALLKALILTRWKDTPTNVLAQLFCKIFQDFCQISCQESAKNIEMSQFFTHTRRQKMAYAPPRNRSKNSLTLRKNCFQNDFCPSSLYAEMSAIWRIEKIIGRILKSD